MLPVVLTELGEGVHQNQGALAALGGKFGNQVGDAVAHHGLERLQGVLRPAVAAADPVPRGGQVLDGVQKGPVQVENHGLIHTHLIISIISFQYREGA